MSLFFSIRQAGVPLGAAVAGASLPAVAQHFGTHIALAAAAAVTATAVALSWPARTTDAETGRGAWRRAAASLGLRSVRLPFQALAATPDLLRLAVVSGALALNQSFWTTFLVLYLVTERGMSLAAAGLLFTTMQIASVAGRLGLGFAADRTGSNPGVVRLAALAALPVTLLLVGGSGPSWVAGVTVALAGALLAGWNGAFLAELARRAPRDRVLDASAGGMLCVQIGFVAGQVLGATLIGLSSGYALAFVVIAAVPTVVVVVDAMRR